MPNFGEPPFVYRNAMNGSMSYMLVRHIDESLELKDIRKDEMLPDIQDIYRESTQTLATLHINFDSSMY